MKKYEKIDTIEGNFALIYDTQWREGLLGTIYSYLTNEQVDDLLKKSIKRAKGLG